MLDKIVRATGLLLLIIGLLMCRHAYYDLNLNGRAAFGAKTIGGGKGSRYKVCGKSDPNVSKMTMDFDEKKVSDMKYYFYDIANPKEYLKGAQDAIAIEKGPYMLKKHAIKYNIGFRKSNFTDAGEPDVNGALEYDVANAYVVLDKNTDVTSGMSRDEEDLTLSWEDSTRQTITSYDKSFPSYLSMSDKITNLSPAYLSALGEANDELSIVLAMSCTPNQVVNIIDAKGKGQCSDNQLNDMSENDCACCMLDDEYAARGEPNDFVSCNDYLDDEGDTLSMLSLLAYYDGGIAIKEKGDDKYDGSGKFDKTTHKQDKIYTPLVQSHSINDILFGYPSAYIGKVIPKVYFAKGEKIMKDAGVENPTGKQIGTEMLTGEMDSKLPFKVGNIAAYTKDVGAVCIDTCSSVESGDDMYDSPLGHTCSGNAPARHKTTETDEIVLGDIDCKPYSTTYYTKKMCKEIDLALDQNKEGYEACKCADGSDDYKNNGCCLASGTYNTLDLTAEGCLYPVAGEAGTNYVGKDADAEDDGKPSVDIGKAVKAWSDHKESSKDAQFMCPAPGILISEHKSFARYEKLSGSSTHEVYVHTGNPRIRQDDVSQSGAKIYSSKVDGAPTEYFPGTGTSATFSDIQLSDGHSSRGKVPVYVPISMAPIMFQEDWAVIAIVCDDDGLCHKATRMQVATDAFTGSDTSTLHGIGMPFDGLQSIGHKKGPGDNGRPTYIHQPLYLNGDKELLTQQNNSYVEAADDGNGVKLYRPKSSDTDPGTFTVGGTNENFELVDETLLEAKKNDLQSHVDFEPATGLGIRSKQRFAVSHSIWECDPTNNKHCKLSRQSDGSGSCYGDTGDKIYSNLTQSVKDVLDAKNFNDFTYPCSAANVMTPDVIGGKIIPMYWYEDSRKEVGNQELSEISELAKEHYKLFESFYYMWLFGWLLFTTLGMGLLFRCFCFAPEKEYLKSGAVGAKKTAVDSTTASSASSAEA